ncbi:pyridoxal phosphate-dependent enzyme, beta subunit [Ramaria rubella]|nr:pyridoxal phosphate-dependent enzyme, beta subunit [Ramaria rubella]
MAVTLFWPKSLSIRLPQSPSISLILGLFIGISLSLSSSSLALYLRQKRERRFDKEHLGNRIERPIELRSGEVLRDGVTGLIGNTPLIRIKSLSEALGVDILFSKGKAEFLNPGGSVKDRVALRVIEDAERQGFLRPYNGSCIFEGTVGSTGISIAMIARARGYNTTIIMPDDVADEKSRTLEALGAKVEKVRPASIVDKKQNLAKQRALEFGHTDISNLAALDDTVVTTDVSEEQIWTGYANGPQSNEVVKSKPRGFFADQFESRSNYDSHFEGTAPEIWRQTNGQINAFVSGAGTGGTLAGIGRFLKTMNESILVALADPEGSGLYNKVKHGVMFDPKESEGTKRRHQVDTVVEGIGINRLTKNFELALPVIDDAFRTTDKEAVAMSRYLVLNDGLFLGSSSACNLVACIRLAKKMRWKEGQVIVTVLCDSGSRHYSKFW